MWALVTLGDPAWHQVIQLLLTGGLVQGVKPRGLDHLPGNDVGPPVPQGIQAIVDDAAGLAAAQLAVSLQVAEGDPVQVNIQIQEVGFCMSGSCCQGCIHHSPHGQPGFLGDTQQQTQFSPAIIPGDRQHHLIGGAPDGLPDLLKVGAGQVCMVAHIGGADLQRVGIKLLPEARVGTARQQAGVIHGFGAKQQAFAIKHGITRALQHVFAINTDIDAAVIEFNQSGCQSLDSLALQVTHQALVTIGLSVQHQAFLSEL